jgi:hypothetical protein
MIEIEPVGPEELSALDSLFHNAVAAMRSVECWRSESIARLSPASRRLVRLSGHSMESSR